MYRWLGAIGVILAWYLVADLAAWNNPALFPTMKVVVMRLQWLLVDGMLQVDLYATVARWLTGFALGVFAGTTAGLLLGMHQRIYEFFEFPIEFLRALPVTAIFPLFLMVFGIGDASKIAMAFTPTFLLLLVNAAYGVRFASRERQRMARSFGASTVQLFWKVVLPEAVPQIFVGLRLGLSLSLVVTVVAEMFIGTEFGLGQRIFDSYLTNAVGTLYAVLLLLGGLGFASNWLLQTIERKFLYWSGK